VRIMACDTSQACVAVTPAATVLQAIGLKACIGDAGRIHLVDVIPRAMASAAEIHKGDRTQPARIENGLAPLLGSSSSIKDTCLAPGP